MLRPRTTTWNWKQLSLQLITVLCTIYLIYFLKISFDTAILKYNAKGNLKEMIESADWSERFDIVRVAHEQCKIRIVRYDVDACERGGTIYSFDSVYDLSNFEAPVEIYDIREYKDKYRYSIYIPRKSEIREKMSKFKGRIYNISKDKVDEYKNIILNRQKIDIEGGVENSYGFGTYYSSKHCDGRESIVTTFPGLRMASGDPKNGEALLNLLIQQCSRK